MGLVLLNTRSSHASPLSRRGEENERSPAQQSAAKMPAAATARKPAKAADVRALFRAVPPPEATTDEQRLPPPEQLIGLVWGIIRKINPDDQNPVQTLKEWTGNVASEQDAARASTYIDVLCALATGNNRDPATFLDTTMAALRGKNESAPTLPATTIQSLIQTAQDAAIAAIRTQVAQTRHDLKNLLTPLLTETSELLETTTGALTRICRTQQRIAALIDLLGTDGEIKPKLRSTNITELMNDLADSAKIKTENEKITITTNIEAGLTAMTDEPLVYSALDNLVGNAIYELVKKHSGELKLSAKTITPSENQPQTTADTIIRGSIPQAPCIEITVKDNGPGFPADFLANAFDVGKTTKGANGSGFGLANVLAIVTAHNGAILLDNKPEKGAKFRVLIPIGDISNTSAPEAGQNSTTSQEAAEYTDLGHTSLVLCDDDPAVVKVLERTLKRLNAQTTIKITSRDDFNRLKKDIPQNAVLILDGQLVGISGTEIATTLKKDGRTDLTIVMLTGSSTDEYSDLLQNGTIDMILTKPFDQNNIKQQLLTAHNDHQKKIKQQ